MSELTALTFHYETQPLPSFTSYWVHHLPRWFHAVSTVVMFVIELNGFDLHDDPAIRLMLIDNHVGYLASLRTTDPYREFANRLPFRFLRTMRARLRRRLRVTAGQ